MQVGSKRGDQVVHPAKTSTGEGDGDGGDRVTLRGEDVNHGFLSRKFCFGLLGRRTRPPETVRAMGQEDVDRKHAKTGQEHRTEFAARKKTGLALIRLNEKMALEIANVRAGSASPAEQEVKINEIRAKFKKDREDAEKIVKN
jgi:hypothetical protein